MLRGADLLPSTFSFDSLTEEQVTEFLDTGMEVLRMIKEGDTESDNGEARELYRNFFNTATTVHSS